MRLAKREAEAPWLDSISLDLNATQISKLDKFLQSGFRFLTLERYGRYFGVERNGFVVLVDPSEGQLRTFGQAGYLIGDGIGMLVERATGKAFVWHHETLAATPELLADYERFRSDVEHLLEDEGAIYA